MNPFRKALNYAGRTEFSRYFWAGCLVTFTDFFVLLVLTEGVGINYLWSNLAAVSAGMVTSYLFCIKWVFLARRYNRVVYEFPLFVLTSIACLVLNEVLLWGLVEIGRIYYVVSKVIVTLAIFIVNYMLKKWVLFNPQREIREDRTG
jgi:putative flippase GtrA